ncbi:MAG TPA: glycosyltransferase family 9 protein, partial [bacterium]|nr:glycosyltransferase family 9 protein [bacterium]
AAPILKEHRDVDEVIVFENRDRHKGLKGATVLVGELRNKRYDVVVDLRNSAIPYFLKTKHKVTAHETHFKNMNSASRHAIDRHLDVLENAGITITTREMNVSIPSRAKKKAAEYFKQKGISGTDGVIAVYPGAGSPYKLYPPDQFREVLESIRSECGCKFLMVGSSADREICERIMDGFSGEAVCTAGDLDLLELGAALERCVIMITNDSGPMHLAVAVGTPTVAIFGPTNAERYGPRGDKHRIVWHREPCNPCKAPECGRSSCIGDIPPRRIVDAALSLLVKENV